MQIPHTASDTPLEDIFGMVDMLEKRAGKFGLIPKAYNAVKGWMGRGAKPGVPPPLPAFKPAPAFTPSNAAGFGWQMPAAAAAPVAQAGSKMMRNMGLIGAGAFATNAVGDLAGNVIQSKLPFDIHDSLKAYQRGAIDAGNTFYSRKWWERAAPRETAMRYASEAAEKSLNAPGSSLMNRIGHRLLTKPVLDGIAAGGKPNSAGVLDQLLSRSGFQDQLQPAIQQSKFLAQEQVNEINELKKLLAARQ